MSRWGSESFAVHNILGIVKNGSCNEWRRSTNHKSISKRLDYENGFWKNEMETHLKKHFSFTWFSISDNSNIVFILKTNPNSPFANVKKGK